MKRRYVALWFPRLSTDWLIRRQPELKDEVFVLAAKEKGRIKVKAASAAALDKGISHGMVVADCRAILPALQVFDYKPELPGKLLTALAEWCIRYTPSVAIDGSDGLLLDASGCAHLWGGELQYLQDITGKLGSFGYRIRTAMADTVGAAWAASRYAQDTPTILPPGTQKEILQPFPVASLRLEAESIALLERLGLRQISSILKMPRAALRRRFGPLLLQRLAQALGEENEIIEGIEPLQPYQERLPSMEPICTATAIGIALTRLLEDLCHRLKTEAKGLRKAIFKAYRADGVMQQIEVSTNKASRHVQHLYRLFELKLETIEPALGFELFVLEAPVVEEVSPEQEQLWADATGSKIEDSIALLLDRMQGKFGSSSIQRYLPAEHYWPERAYTPAASLQEKPTTAWRTDKARPLHLLAQPERIEVTVPIPDYPPLLFHYQGCLHRVKRADGPERIEREWWLDTGEHRDYYCVEDEEGARYWLFRLGHYNSGNPQWFIHGFFA